MKAKGRWGGVVPLVAAFGFGCGSGSDLGGPTAPETSGPIAAVAEARDGGRVEALVSELEGSGWEGRCTLVRSGSRYDVKFEGHGVPMAVVTLRFEGIADRDVQADFRGGFGKTYGWWAIPVSWTPRGTTRCQILKHLETSTVLAESVVIPTP